MNCSLLLEDGTYVQGTGMGSRKTVIAEVVFNTGMTGYQETVTDPSYKGQIVLFTSPHIGNTGVNRCDTESAEPCVEGVIMKKYSPSPSSFRAENDLDSYLNRHNVTGMQGVDTRMLTRAIRAKGCMPGIMSSETHDRTKLAGLLSAETGVPAPDLVARVTSRTAYAWRTPIDRSWYRQAPGNTCSVKRITVIDFGIKHSILRFLAALGCAVTCVPAAASAEDVMATSPDGIVLSNGPGDPACLDREAKTAAKLIKRSIPVLGICLGHQLIALGLGARTFKLAFGHHGINHPVKDLHTGQSFITSQNHNYAVDVSSLENTGLRRTHTNLNDNTVEGMAHETYPVVSVQFHPEAGPGPHEAAAVFSTFLQMIDTRKASY